MPGELPAYCHRILTNPPDASKVGGCFVPDGLDRSMAFRGHSGKAVDKPLEEAIGLGVGDVHRGGSEAMGK